MGYRAFLFRFAFERACPCGLGVERGWFDGRLVARGWFADFATGFGEADLMVAGLAAGRSITSLSPSIVLPPGKATLPLLGFDTPVRNMMS
jgi:hypothetical protein